MHRLRIPHLVALAAIALAASLPCTVAFAGDDADVKAAEKEKKLAEAKLAAEKARRELERLASEADLDRQLKAAQLDKALADARQSEQKTLPALEGKTTIGKDVSIEAHILATAELNDVAAEIATVVKAKAALGKSVVIAAAGDPQLPTFLYELLWKQLESFKSQYEHARATLFPVIDLSTMSRLDSGEFQSAEMGLAAITSGLQPALDLVSLFRADTEVVGVPVSIDDFALVAAVAGELSGHNEVFVPRTHVAAKGSPLLDLLRQVASARIESLDLLAGLGPSPSAEQKKVKELIEKLNQQWDKLVTALAGKNEATGGSLIQAIASAERLGPDDAHLLVVDIIATGGSNRARRNLFTTLFSGDLLSHSGGAVAAYLLFDVSGKVVTAGTVKSYQPYTKQVGG